MQKKGDIHIELDTERTWRLTMNARSRMEERLALRPDPIGFDEFLARIDTWSSEDWKQFIWCGMTGELITIDVIGDLLTHDQVMAFKLQFTEMNLTSMERAMASVSEEFKKKYLQGGNVAEMIREARENQQRSTPKLVQKSS